MSPRRSAITYQNSTIIKTSTYSLFMGRFYDEIEHCIHRIRLLNRQEDRKLDEKNLFDQIFAMLTEKCRAKSFVTFLINFLSEAEMLD